METAAQVEYKRGSPIGQDGLFYPCEEDREVPLTGPAIRMILYVYQALRAVLYPRHELVYVAADQFIYYRPHDPRANVAPDVWVCFGVPKEPERTSFRTWEEEATPSFVVEVSSKLSRAQDSGPKLALYRDVLQCPEYMRYDEAREQLELYRRDGGEYRLVPAAPDGRVYSQELDVWFGKDPDLLVRVYSPREEPVPWYEEIALERAELARRNTGLARENAALSGRAEALAQHAALEVRLRERAEREAAEERERAEALAAELAALRAEVERLRQERGSA